MAVFSNIIKQNRVFHMDVPSDPDGRTFLDLLTSMGLKQHVSVPTHISGHTLDLVITRAKIQLFPVSPWRIDICQITLRSCVH